MSPGLTTGYEHWRAKIFCTLEALEARSAQASKLANMKHLAQVQAKKNSAAIGAQTKVVIEIGTRTASGLEKLWWDFHQEAFAQAETKFNELFFRAYEWPEVLNKYRPLALLEWLKPPDLLRTTSLDIKITRARQ